MIRSPRGRFGSARTDDRARADDAQLVRAFYEREGWQWADGVSGDAARWGMPDPGPIQARLGQRRAGRLRELLGLDGVTSGTARPRALELGAGGQPAASVLRGVASYVEADFSRRGLETARHAAAKLGVGTAFVEADARALPLRDARFDVVYSAHMLYHLPTAPDQERVLEEMVRVLAPGGILAVVTANPYPWLFLGRCIRRVVADTPGLGRIADGLRRPPPLPYLPRSVGWMRRVLGAEGSVTVHAVAVPTTWFSRHVSETTWWGRLLWGGVVWLETSRPDVARTAGAYVAVVLRKDRRDEAGRTGRPPA